MARTTLLRCLLKFRLFLLVLKYCSSVNIFSRHAGYCSQQLKSSEAIFGRHWRPLNLTPVYIINNYVIDLKYKQIVSKISLKNGRKTFHKKHDCKSATKCYICMSLSKCPIVMSLSSMISTGSDYFALLAYFAPL